MKSILQTEKVCWRCGNPNVHKHHIYFAGNRQVSEENGFWIWLCPVHHNMSDFGIHFDKGFDEEVKKRCQMEYEKTHTREEFMKLIGRNYL